MEDQKLAAWPELDDLASLRSKFKVVELTCPAAIRQRLMLQQTAWCPSLTPQQYLAREDCLAAHHWSTDRLRTWVLTSSEKNLEHDDESQSALLASTLASLETYRLDAISPSGAPVAALALASVFTEPCQRGRGHASSLCRLICEEAKKEDEVAAVVLFSDVGAKIYSRSGFETISHPLSYHLFSLSASSPNSSHLAQEAASGVRLLTREEAGEAAEEVHNELRRLHSQGSFLIFPTQGQIAVVDSQTVDTINILQATMLAMSRCVFELHIMLHVPDASEHARRDTDQIAGMEAVENEQSLRPSENFSFVLFDGPRSPENLPINCRHECVVKGDSKCQTIAAASILAKVTRDRMMDDYDRLYPLYGFKLHKGYGTAAHIKAILQHGPCPIHRRSFAPVKDWDLNRS